MKTSTFITLFVSILALIVSIITAIYSYLQEKKLRRLELIKQTTDNNLIIELPKYINEVLLVKNNENVENAIECLSKNRTRILFLKYYQEKKYETAKEIIMNLEDKLSEIGNIHDLNNTIEIEKLTKKLIKEIHK